MRSNGYRRRTRSLFRKDHRDKGMPNPAKGLIRYKMGDLVTCVVDPSIQKGMPHKTLQGKIGKVFNNNPRSIGVIFYRRIRGNYVEKQVHMRPEHLKPSRMGEDDRIAFAEWRRRKANNEECVKRQIEGPREAIRVPMVGEPVVLRHSL